MDLKEIDLKGYGRFCEEPGSFECLRYRLPSPWDYCYANGDVLLRIRADGAGYLQVNPPSGVPLIGGPPLLFRENGHVAPNMMTWLIPEKPGRRVAFTNFWLPAMPCAGATDEPVEYRCKFTPARACYRVVEDDWMMETTASVPPHGAAMMMTVSVTNRGRDRRDCTIMPVIKPYLASLLQAPWDVACWYQTIAFCRVEGKAAFWLQTRDAGGTPSRRLHAGIISDLDPDSVEVSYDRFVGAGDWNSPRAVCDGTLALPVRGTKGVAWGEAKAENAAAGQPPLAAMAKRLSLRPDESFEFTMVVAKLPDRSDGELPPPSTLASFGRYLSAPVRDKALEQINRHCEMMFGSRQLRAPDKAMSRYVNEFVPLQAYWVSMLDRGWPGGFRGVRDAAQDATSIIPLEPALARSRLVEIYNTQRSDGWFPRSYYVDADAHPPITATHVDAGVWVWDLLYEYVCFTRDFDVLEEKTRWLDRDGSVTILDHTLRIFDYYLKSENLGQHRLCKIRGGDWNDSVNRAGVEGRGESVMVSCQVVLALEQAVDMLGFVDEIRGSRKWARRADTYAKAAAEMRRNLMRHAMNSEGYFNGVFNDAGRWIFSPKDPDGRRRVNGPANSFAVVAGVVQGEEREKVFKALGQLKGPFGWRLFHPAIGEPPIPKLGRIGQGDLAPGLGENGTPYNHGSHGFLGRAVWTAGKGNMLYEVMRYMFPYDQQTHPVDVARTAPYGIVNHWKEAIGMEGIGGDVFLSGSIATSLRNVYDGIAGFRADLRHVVIDPCIPAAWEGMEYDLDFMGSRLHVVVQNEHHVETGVEFLRLDGKLITDRFASPRLGRKVAIIPLDKFGKAPEHLIEAIMG